MDRDTELALVERLRQGDADAFDAVHAALNVRLFTFLLRLTRRRDVAEDLLEETWMRLVTHGARLRADTRLAPWLFTVARHLYLSYRRSRVIEDSATAGLMSLWPFVVNHASPFEATAANELERRIERALAALPVASREVLLCAGALQSPQLLMLSGIGPGPHLQQHGVTVVHDLPGVGQHLHDHVDVVQVVHAPHLKDLFGLSLSGMVRAVKGIFEWRNFRTGMLTTNFAEAGGFIRSQPGEELPDLQFHFVIGKLVDHGRKTVFGHGYSCHVCLLRPASRGSVMLASADAMQAPLIDPAFLAERDDMDRMVRGFKLMRRLLQQPALAGYRGQELPVSARAQTDEQIEQFIRNHGDTIYHPVGSCRMGNGPTDVVDARLRVHGLQGLRVVDASIMPRIVGGNTNAPTIMIAEKAADMIRVG